MRGNKYLLCIDFVKKMRVADVKQASVCAMMPSEVLQK